MKLRTMTALGMAASCLVLAACSPKPSSSSANAPVAAREALADDKAGVPGAPAANDPAAALAVPQLAYDYSYDFMAPPQGADALMRADQATCESAGPAQCQIVSLTANNNSDEGFSARTLELRVTPAWLKTWQGGLDNGLKQAHGRISAQHVTSEDLSLQIVDSQAHIKNQEALRDRLADIIRTSPGKISDLIDAEKQLSDVQADIDASQSALAVMQKRVATSHLTLNYQSAMSSAPSGLFAPITDALHGSLRAMISVIGFLITATAFLLPFAVIGGAVWWLFFRGKRKAG